MCVLRCIIVYNIVIELYVYKKYTIWNFSLSAEANHSLLVKAAVHIRQLMSFLMKMTSCLAHPLVSDQVHDWTVAVIMIWTWMPQMYRPVINQKKKKVQAFQEPYVSWLNSETHMLKFLCEPPYGHNNCHNVMQIVTFSYSTVGYVRVP